MKILITGGAGFIGSCFVRQLLQSDSSAQVTTLDALTYCGSLEALAAVKDHPRHRFERGDICDRKCVERILKEQTIDTVVNFAAESHVDRSISSPEQFMLTNVIGTQVLLDASRKAGVGRFVQISTDEVYGSLGEHGVFTEDSPLCPSSPYSASKAAADLLCLAYFKTYGFPVMITRSTNAYGPFQFPEKLIPVMIERALEDKPLPLYGDGKNVRTWIYVEDNCSAIQRVVERGTPGRVYNISSAQESTNLDIAHAVLQTLGKPNTLIQFVTDRPGHDWRYALDASRLRTEFSWQPKVTLSDGLRRTVDWYVQNRTWVQDMKRRIA